MYIVVRFVKKEFQTVSFSLSKMQNKKMESKSKTTYMPNLTNECLCDKHGETNDSVCKNSNMLIVSLLVSTCNIYFP